MNKHNNKERHEMFAFFVVGSQTIPQTCTSKLHHRQAVRSTMGATTGPFARDNPGMVLAPNARHWLVRGPLAHYLLLVGQGPDYVLHERF
jgi:hypothetical protein